MGVGSQELRYSEGASGGGWEQGGSGCLASPQPLLEAVDIYSDGSKFSTLCACVLRPCLHFHSQALRAELGQAGFKVPELENGKYSPAQGRQGPTGSPDLLRQVLALRPIYFNRFNEI